MLQMVSEFGKMGILEPRPGIENDPDFPPVMFVESLTDERLEETRARWAARLAECSSTLPEAIQQAGWDSIEQWEEFRRITFG
jgi:hypothetical protein